MYEELLIPLDGTEEGEAVLPHAAELAAKLGARVTLLRAIKPLARAQRETMPTMLPGASPTAVDMGMETAREMTGAEHDAAERYLEGIGADLRARGIDVRSAVAQGAPAPVIAEYAAANGVDLIAMSSRRRGGLTRALVGSVADEVLRHAGCPLLLLRSG